jgi:protein subunit release factor B
MGGKVEFSVRISDCREEHYRGSGNGGQKKQKTSSGVRLTHEPSAVTVECEAQRSQHKNRVEALRKLANHPKFRAWCSAESRARAEGHASLERKIDASLEEKNLLVEVTDKHAPGEAYCDVKK